MNLKEFLKLNPPNNKYVFGRYIKYCRESQYNKSVRAMAQELGLTASYLSDIENGKRYAPFKILPRFIQVFEIQEDEKQDFMDLAYLTKGKGFPDLSEYLWKHPTARQAVRKAMEKDLSGEDFLAIVESVIEK